MDMFSEINDIQFGKTLSKETHISPIKVEDSESTSRSRSNDQCMPKHSTTFQVHSLSSTSSKNNFQHIKNLHEAKLNPSDSLMTNFNQPFSTVKTLKTEFPSRSEDTSTSTRNPAQGIYDNVRDIIYTVITSEMKIDVLDTNDLYAQAEKFKILKEISAKCNNLAAKLKGKMKSQVDNLKPKHPNETYPQYMKELDTIIGGLPSTSADSDVIPKSIKSIITEMINSEKNTLAISHFETFFNKAKNKRNIKHVAISLNIPISRLKNQLKQIRMRYYRVSQRGCKEETKFMNRLERIIKSLN